MPSKVQQLGMKDEHFIEREAGLKVNLPKQHLPIFDGNIQQWPKIWDALNPQYMNKHYQLFLSLLT